MRTRVQKFFNSPSLTKQSEANSVNINYIYSRYKRAGVNLLDPARLNNYVYNDSFCESPIFDFREAQNRLIYLQDTFRSLTAEQRAAFKNDAILFAQTVAQSGSDESAYDSLSDLGIFPKRTLPSKAPAGSSEETPISDNADVESVSS